MSDKRQLTSGGVATVRKPRLVMVGGVGGGTAGKVAEQFRKLEWDVCAVPTSEDLACAVLARRPSAVVIPVETGWETGYLLAAKLRKAKPRMKVVLVAPTRTAEAERFAKFVGATLVAETDGAAKLVSAVTS
jgi:biotin carboxylase